jgi:hypothetical protein
MVKSEKKKNKTRFDFFSLSNIALPQQRRKKQEDSNQIPFN